MTCILAADADYRWFLDLDLWPAVTFTIVVIILARTAVGPLVSGLRARQKGIEDQLRELEQAEREIRALREEQAAKQRELRQKALEMVEEAKRDAKVTREAMIARAGDEIERIKSRTIRDIELAKRKAIHDLADHATELSMRLAEERLASNTGRADHDRLIEQALEEMMSPTGRAS